MNKAKNLLNLCEASPVDDLSNILAKQIKGHEDAKNGGMIPVLVSDAIQKALSQAYQDDDERADALKWIKYHVDKIK